MTPTEPVPNLPLLMPLGDGGLLVRFGDALTDAANTAALHFAVLAEIADLQGVVEVVPNLVSVLLRYDSRTTFEALAGEVRLLAARPIVKQQAGAVAQIEVIFDGEDIVELANSLGMTASSFIAAHNREPLRVLATGFAPGFVYCGMHGPDLVVPRRDKVRPRVAAGTVLFAAGQTAITSTDIPTGWHVIGRTTFRNFDAAANPPATLRSGDRIRFVSA